MGSIDTYVASGKYLKTHQNEEDLPSQSRQM